MHSVWLGKESDARSLVDFGCASQAAPSLGQDKDGIRA